MVPNVPVKILNAPEIIIVGVFPNTDIWSFNQILQKAQLIVML